MPAPAIVHTASAIASTGGTPTASVTASAGDVIALFSYVESGNTGAAPSVSGVTAPAGSGLAFAQRSHTPTGRRGIIELWWAVATAAVSAVPVTVAYAGGYDDAAVAVLTVSGCNQAAPWDPNPSLPAVQSFDVSGTPAVVISTTNANDLLLFATGANGSWGGGGGAAGFGDGSAGAFNAGASLWAELFVSAKAVTAAQSNASFNWSSQAPAAGGAGNVEALFHALTAGGGQAGASGSSPSSQAFAVIMA